MMPRDRSGAQEIGCDPINDNDDRVWRQRLRAERVAQRLALATPERARREALVQAHLHHLLPRLEGHILGLYWPHRGEPDLRAAMLRWSAGCPGRELLLPVVDGAGLPLRFRRWTANARMAEDRYGIAHPADGEWCEPQILLIPLNAFDRAGFRLGYGAGYFDRTLASLSGRVCAVGVGFELGRVETIRPAGHDRRMDWLVTESGVFRPASR